MPDTNVDVVNINIKEVVKEKYGQAALRVTNKTAAAVAAERRRPADCRAIRSPRISTTRRRPGRFPKRRCWLRSDAAIQPRWRS